MDGLAAIGSRMAEINAQLARLSAPTVTSVASTRSAATTSSTNPSTAGTSGSRSFADALASALTSTTDTGAGTSAGIATTRTAATPHSAPTHTVSTTPTAPTEGSSAVSGRLTASGVPVELAKYGNGRVPAAALESIGGGHRLWAPAAEAFGRLKSAAQRAGVSIGVTDSYRSYAQQVDVARRKGLHSQGGLAAKPGTSEHGWGKSLDLDLSASALRWMRSHGKEYGFTENVSREPWHWTFAAR
jgi:D-alanyl-D-alanine carboxypeptidase